MLTLSLLEPVCPTLSLSPAKSVNISLLPVPAAYRPFLFKSTAAPCFLAKGFTYRKWED